LLPVSTAYTTTSHGIVINLMDVRLFVLKAGKFPAGWWNGIHPENHASYSLKRIIYRLLHVK